MIEFCFFIAGGCVMYFILTKPKKEILFKVEQGEWLITNTGPNKLHDYKTEEYTIYKFYKNVKTGKYRLECEGYNVFYHSLYPKMVIELNRLNGDGV